MPFDLRISDGDIVVEPFDIQLNEEGLEAIGQRLAIRLQAFQGEYFLDTAFGTPWLQSILRKNPSINLVNSLLRRVVADTPGISQVLSLTTNITTDRCLEVNFRARIEEQVVDAVLQTGPEPALCIYQAPPGNDVVFTFPLGGPAPSGAANLDFNCD